jgi:hypothetical protein
MKSPYCFIIKAVDGRRYDNIRNYEGKEFIISSSQEDHKVANRFATVISTPIYYNGPIEPGDIVVVHHNVFKFYYDMKGRQKSSWHHLTDDLFIVETDQVYLYSRDGGRWAAPSPFCFIRPIPSEDKIFSSTSGLEELWGELVFKNEEMTEVTEGDIVSFTPESEYEFRINEEVLYRMYNRNICLKK